MRHALIEFLHNIRFMASTKYSLTRALSAHALVSSTPLSITTFIRAKILLDGVTLVVCVGSTKVLYIDSRTPASAPFSSVNPELVLGLLWLVL